MKMMTTLLSIFILFTSCEKEEVQQNFLPGAWGLNKTELFVNDSLQGASEYDEITTTYLFETCDQQSDAPCNLVISEDGESQFFQYEYDRELDLITLDNNNIYQIEIISESNLVLSKEYGNNKSTWSFIKE